MFFPLVFAVAMGLLLNAGAIEGAQAIAAHESPHTMKLYDRRAMRGMRLAMVMGGELLDIAFTFRWQCQSLEGEGTF
ncbi:MAG: hypothetical protein F9K13_10095 [Candidatus Methylomirabilis oxygeniifera]|uniref:Uncharacterized protein n=1 Tax=Methylomirabilis oxygeniifera TaxID=671143 RepID=D5MG68_METO1|nr:MAG: hypothetical protein F9K13_10095 [Candidatus Methylomirabilis oxyfera]CBE68749.1 exported protein of unknown function [Candidatus Methylomirabilis oxyfera]